MSSEEKKTPWRNGYWFNKQHKCFVNLVNGEKVESKNLVCLDYPETKSVFSGTWTYGDFGPAPKDVVETTGIENHNVMMDYGMFQLPGVLTEDGARIHAAGFTPGVYDIIDFLDEEKLEALKEDRDPVESPSYPAYITPQPEKQGKLAWVSGPPGAGKSTTAQLLARNHGYVYYEGDCLSMFVNPFVDVLVDNPSTAQVTQKPLKVHIEI